MSRSRGEKLSAALGIAILGGGSIAVTAIEVMRHKYLGALINGGISIVALYRASKLCSDAEGELVDKYNNLVNDYNSVGQKYNALQDKYNGLLGDSKELAKQYAKALSLFEGLKDSLEKEMNKQEVD